MENKKLGLILVVLGILVGGTFLYYNSVLGERSKELGCFDNAGCLVLEKSLSVSHIGVGIFSFILALGFYLLFFNKTEKAILEKLESEKNEKVRNMKFDILMKALDEYEKKVMKIIKEQDGITQSTLRIKVDMSKAKLSYVLSDLEKKGLIKRIQKGKTLSVWLKI